MDKPASWSASCGDVQVVRCDIDELPVHERCCLRRWRWTGIGKTRCEKHLVRRLINLIRYLEGVLRKIIRCGEADLRRPGFRAMLAGHDDLEVLHVANELSERQGVQQVRRSDKDRLRHMLGERRV